MYTSKTITDSTNLVKWARLLKLTKAGSHTREKKIKKFGF